MEFKNISSVDDLTNEEVREYLLDIGYVEEELYEFNEYELREFLKELHKELGKWMKLKLVMLLR